MTVFAGMLVATILGVCLIPMLFVFVEKVTGGSKKHAAATPAVPQSLATEHGQGSH
jgi:HAE1 family hydrophobic/amphiphilic exporter-1